MKKYRITVDGKTYEVEVEEVGEQSTNTSIPPTRMSNVSASVSSTVSIPKINHVSNKGMSSASVAASSSDSLNNNIGGRTEVKAPVTGSVLRVEIKQGDQVQAGQKIIVLEAMKMETDIQSPVSGTVGKILVNNGKNVNNGQTMLIIESDSV